MSISDYAGLPELPELPPFRATWFRQPYTVQDDLLRPDGGGRLEEYLPLAEARKGSFLVDDLARLDPTKPLEISEFASSWGPLGLFFHRLEEVRFLVDEAGAMLMLTPDDALPDGPMREFAWRPSRAASYVGVDDAARAICELGLGRVSRREGDAEVRTSLRMEGERFFPRGFPPYLFPGPRLFQVYCEPLDLWVREVRRFQEFIRRITRYQDPEVVLPHPPELTFEAYKNFVPYRLELDLASEVAGVAFSPSVDLERRRVYGALAFPSLLTAAYVALLDTLTRGDAWRVCHCRTCRSPFRGRGTYCTEGCRKREWRLENRPPTGLPRGRRPKSQPLAE